MKNNYRAWNVEECIMHDVAFPAWNGATEVWQDNKPQTKVQYLSQHGPEDQGILMQKTAVADMKGIEITEGDVVEDCEGNQGYVKYKDGRFILDGCLEMGDNEDLDMAVEYHELFIVGHIFDETYKSFGWELNN